MEALLNKNFRDLASLRANLSKLQELVERDKKDLQQRWRELRVQTTTRLNEELIKAEHALSKTKALLRVQVPCLLFFL